MLYEIVEISVYINTPPPKKKASGDMNILDTIYSKACRLKEGLNLIQEGSRLDGEI